MAIPSDLALAAQWNGGFDLDYVRDGGSNVASPTGNPAIVSSGKFSNALDLIDATPSSLRFSGSGLIDGVVQTGTISFWVKPNYTGSPSVQQNFFFSTQYGGYTNRISIWHTASGVLQAYINGSSFIGGITNAWSPTSGTWYHIELDFDVTSGASRLFVDGTQVGSTLTATGTRGTTANSIEIGANNGSTSVNAFVIDEFLVYDTVQNTTNFTPPTSEMDLSIDVDLIGIEVLDSSIVDVGMDLFWWIKSPSVPGPTPPPPWVAPNLKQPLEKYEDLTGTITKFLGYRPTGEELEEFPYDIYTFLIYSLRQRDQNQKLGGTALLKRFLMGPQEVWYDLHRACTRLNTLFDPEEIAAEYLHSLMRLVGFGNDLNDIYSVASEKEIRRIISGAIEFWRERWLDLGIDTAIRIVTGNRYKVRDYFDFRYIIGEQLITEDLENEDSNAISVQTLELFKQSEGGVCQYGASADWFLDTENNLFYDKDIGSYIVIFNDTGSPSNNGIYEIVDVDPIAEIAIVDPPFPRYQVNAEWFQGFKNDEYLTEIRVVDEKTGQGEVNRELLEKMLGLQRYLSERFNVVYVDFLDLFEVKADLGQWDEIPGTGTIVSVDNGVMVLSDTGLYGGVLTNRSTSSGWENYQWKSKISFTTDPALYLLLFLYQDGDNSFHLSLSYDGFGSCEMQLFHNVGGVSTPISSVIPLPSLSPNTFWTYTIEAMKYESGVTVRVFVDGNEYIDVYRASAFTSGNVGYLCGLSTTIEIAETELWQYPLDIIRIGPNP